MFKRSSKTTELDIFSNTTTLLTGKSLKIYEDTTSWHNQFRKHVTSIIDENLFSKLYSTTNGSPNASIRLLISMMILKESRGMSDQELFENARFNALFRSAIGLMNADDKVPAESTYYLFRKKVNAYANQENINLFDQVFKSLTQTQCLEFEVSGKRIRMDSKLLGSNIAYLSRYELVHETLRLCSKLIDKSNILDLETLKIIDDILKYDANKIVYTSTSSELKTKLEKLGLLIYQILPFFESHDQKQFKTLRQVFNQQYFVDQEQLVLPRENKDISSKSIQSPHDTDCDYRNKNGKKTKGCSINITESCDDDSKLNLIGNVDVRPATTADVDFFQNSITSCETVFTNKAENIHADGAYNSVDNQKFCDTNDANLHLHAIQGAVARYDLSRNKNDELEIYDTKRNIIVDHIEKTTKKGALRWRIKTESGYRYFGDTNLKTCEIRRKISNTPTKILQKRNNVEATIFQLGYHYRNNKSRYRGLIKHQMWANMRCLWVNFVRILNYNTDYQNISDHSIFMSLKIVFKKFINPVFDYLRNPKLKISRFSQI